MEVQFAGQALLIACEMEKRAIKLYERALLLFSQEDIASAIRAILTEEKRHLSQFETMRSAFPCDMKPDDERLLQAESGDILFQGGLMEAHRKGALCSAEALFDYAANEERNAATCYTRFAENTQGEAAQIFRAIAQEEQCHLCQLLTMKNAVK